jgi:hypothetical protein
MVSPWKSPRNGKDDQRLSSSRRLRKENEDFLHDEAKDFLHDEAMLNLFSFGGDLFVSCVRQWSD